MSDLSACCYLRLTKTRCREVAQETLETFQRKFAHVFFCPGNHDLWCTGDGDGATDSLHKLQQLEALCTQLGVHTGSPQLWLLRPAHHSSPWPWTTETSFRWRHGACRPAAAGGGGGGAGRRLGHTHALVVPSDVRHGPRAASAGAARDARHDRLHCVPLARLAGPAHRQCRSVRASTVRVLIPSACSFHVGAECERRQRMIHSCEGAVWVRRRRCRWHAWAQAHGPSERPHDSGGGGASQRRALPCSGRGIRRADGRGSMGAH